MCPESSNKRTDFCSLLFLYKKNVRKKWRQKIQSEKDFEWQKEMWKRRFLTPMYNLSIHGVFSIRKMGDFRIGNQRKKKASDTNWHLTAVHDWHQVKYLFFVHRMINFTATKNLPRFFCFAQMNYTHLKIKPLSTHTHNQEWCSVIFLLHDKTNKNCTTISLGKKKQKPQFFWH